jgi:hypothetical protein
MMIDLMDNKTINEQKGKIKWKEDGIGRREKENEKTPKRIIPESECLDSILNVITFY